MIVRYGSPAYILSLILPIALCALLFFVLRRRSERTQRAVILSIMIVNVLQHLLKTLIYPHLNLAGFSALSMAYNMCALLILLSPVAFFVKFSPLRDFIYLIGMFAGILAVAIPYWSIGKPAWDPDFLRSLFCHTLLFLSSGLTVLLGLHKPTRKTFWFIGVEFIFALGIIVLNNCLALALDIYPGVSTADMSFTDALYATNSVWMFGPPESFSWVVSLAKWILPDFLVVLSDGRCVPVLWYSIPLYVLLTIISYPICRFFIWYQERFAKESR